MGEQKGIWFRQDALDLGLSLTHTAIISMAINMPNNLHASNRSIAKMLNTSVRTIIRTIADLQDKGLISISGNTSSRVITAKMAQVEESSYSQIGISTTAKLAHTSAILSRTTAKLATNIKDSKDKKENIKVTIPEKDEYIKLAELIVSLHKVSDPVFKKSSAHINNWAQDIRKLVEIDNRNLSEVERIIRWAKEPQCFWFPNIISGKKLREKFPTLYAQAGRNGDTGDTEDPEKRKRLDAYYDKMYGKD